MSARVAAGFWFQSTPLHEGRRDYQDIPGAKSLFQSTPLHEGRLQKSKALKLLRISSEIRAPSERTDDFVCLPFYEIHLSK